MSLLLPTILIFRIFRILNEVLILLTLSKQHCKVFGDKFRMLDCRKLKSLEDHRGSAKIKCKSVNKRAPYCRLNAKFVRLLRKLTLFKTKIKVTCLTLEKGF